MVDLNYLVVGNLSHVRTPGGMQLSVAYLLIDQHPEEHSKIMGSEIRQVRGFNWSGMHVFTVWIKPGDELEMGDCESNMKMLRGDGTLLHMGPTGIVRIGTFECALVKSDPDREFVVWDNPCHTSDPEPIIDKLEEYYRAPNIPVTIHVPVASRRGLRDRLVTL